MIYLNHKDFEKIAETGAFRTIRNLVGRILGKTERAVIKERTGTVTKSKMQDRIEGKKKKRVKYSKLQPRPKVETSGLRRAKKTTIDDTESHSMRRAIERSKNPKKVLTEVQKSTEPIYAGGNTASNMRGVIRAEEKKYREGMKKRFGKQSRLPKSSFY